MLLACWSVKGGVGVSVVATSLAAIAASGEGSALLVDLGGDVPAIAGTPDPCPAGLTDWLAGGEAVPADALGRLEVDLGPGLRLLARGRSPAEPAEDRVAVAVGLLASQARTVVVDCGPVLGSDEPPAPTATLAASLLDAADLSLLVLRGCFLALRRAMAAPRRPTGVILVEEPGRALGRFEVEEVLGVPVVARIPLDSAIARAVDAGLLLRRPPAALDRALRHVA